jgi:N-acetylmuramic acid 6-phosphate etherase
MTLYLCFDAGATHTRAGLYAEDRTLLAESEGPGANPVVLGVHESIARLQLQGTQLLHGRSFEELYIAAGISGAGRGASCGEIARELSREFSPVAVRVTNDLVPLVFANTFNRNAILVIAGTGSSVYAQSAQGDSTLVGGRGTAFGEPGSAYHIANLALQAAARAHDGIDSETELVERLTNAAGLNKFDDLVGWLVDGDKKSFAGLAATVVAAAEEDDDRAAQVCMQIAANELAAQSDAARKKLGLLPSTTVLLNGGMFEHGTYYQEVFADALATTSSTASPALAELRSHRAVLELALTQHVPKDVHEEAGRIRRGSPQADGEPEEEYLDDLSPYDIVSRMLYGGGDLRELVSGQSKLIANVIHAVTIAYIRGGRLIFIGAGTSGRLGVLDASECPPTFGVDPERVIGIIAGGEAALRISVEGAEDDREQAVADLQALQPRLGPNDVVVGIAASGTTPYVHAALDYAKTLEAVTALVACNPAASIQADHRILLDTGPEAIAGSTRLNAGTATKMVLNIISTGTMTRVGLVYRGRMVGMKPVNAKLRARAVRIVGELGPTNAERAKDLLDEAKGSIAVAIIMARDNCSAAVATNVLKSANGSLRKLFEEMR